MAITKKIYHEKEKEKNASHCPRTWPMLMFSGFPKDKTSRRCTENGSLSLTSLRYGCRRHDDGN